MVADFWAGEGWRITFTRPLGERDWGEWERLICLLDAFQLNEEVDKFRCILTKSGEYSSSSLYKRLLFRGVNNRRMRKMWASRLPQKIKVFAWMVSQNRL